MTMLEENLMAEEYGGTSNEMIAVIAGISHSFRKC
jgi:hypothetical protein